MEAVTTKACALTAEGLLRNWQGHRDLTRKTIEAFPEEKLFGFSLGGMRPFGEMAWEMIRMAVPIAEGVATGEWKEFSGKHPETKSELLAVWDEQTAELKAWFGRIPAGRFSEVDTAFGQWKNPGVVTILYGIDNEIHHRGQGYVYLRVLGIEPPHFWEREM
jgi:uncharacterized damage-inducible protein DinB